MSGDAPSVTGLETALAATNIECPLWVKIGHSRHRPTDQPFGIV